MQQFILDPVKQSMRPSFVSENYGFVQTQPLVELIENTGWKLESTKVARVYKKERQGMQKHQLTFRHPNYASDIESVPQLILRNSHDRTSALEFHLGIFRFACSNGLIIGDSLLSSFKVYHTGKDLESKVKKVLIETLGNVPKVLETRQLMKQKGLSNQEYSDFLNSAKELVQDIRGFESIDSSWLERIRRQEDTSQDLWTVFNRTQENALGSLTGIEVAVNDRGEQVRRMKRGRSVKSLDMDLKLNKGLFNIAMNYL